MAVKKMALLRCTIKIFEVMETQHNNLLATISGVESYKEK